MFTCNYMHRSWFVSVTSLALAGTLAAACSDDDPADGNSTQAAGSVSSSATSTGPGSGGSGGGEGGAGASGGEGGSATGGAGGGGSACLPAEILEPLQAHVLEMQAVASLMAGHPGAGEATGFFVLPGLPSPPAISNVFASLFMPCSAPTLYDPYCEGDLCSRIECTGTDASWIMHHYLAAPPLMIDGYTFTDGKTDVVWAAGDTGVTVTLTSAATGPGDRDWSMTGNGKMDEQLLELHEEYPALFAGGGATLDMNVTPATATGSLVIGRVLIAELDPQGHLQATGFCP